uniref:Uncharacterized protein n=1 Tax=Oryza meridionalis TaxID=40149 RepID=A0A0E0F7L9_9ORYZ
MSSPLEMFEEDVLIVMREEKITGVFGLMEDKRSNEYEEFSVSIKKLTPTTEDGASSPPQESPSSAPTRCSTNYSHSDMTASSNHIVEETAPTVTIKRGDSEEKDHGPFIITKDLSKFTSPKCSMKCFQPGCQAQSFRGYAYGAYMYHHCHDLHGFGSC